VRVVYTCMFSRPGLLAGSVQQEHQAEGVGDVHMCCLAECFACRICPARASGGRYG
jgi:hypothetical protein